MLRKKISKKDFAIPNDQVYYLTNKMLSSGKGNFKMSENHLPKAKLVTGKKNERIIGDIGLRPKEHTLEDLYDEEIQLLQQEMYDKVQQLDDSLADVLDCISILWGEKASHINDFVSIDVDDILKLRDKKQRRNTSKYEGGYRPKQREEVASKVRLLELVSIRTYQDMYTVPGLDKREWEFRVINIASVRTDIDLNNAPAKIVFLIKLGDLFAYKILKKRQTALIPQTILSYDPKKYSFEKRLGRYLTYLWRNRHRDGSYCDPIKVGTILDEIQLNERYGKPGRIKNRLEQAIENLEEEGIIGEAIFKGLEELNTRKRGWLEDYRKCQIIFVPPEHTMKHYRQIARKGEQPKRQQRQQDYSELLNEACERLNLTLAMAAEQIGISVSQVSRIRCGHSQPRGKTQQKIDRWLKKNKPKE